MATNAHSKLRRIIIREEESNGSTQTSRSLDSEYHSGMDCRTLDASCDGCSVARTRPVMAGWSWGLSLFLNEWETVALDINAIRSIANDEP